MSKFATRREAIKSIAATGGVLVGAGAITYRAYDPGGFDVADPEGERQVRSFEVDQASKLKMAIAKSSKDPAVLTRRAIDALGGMKRFISRGDIVAIKPNIGWDRMPVHAANTNPKVVATLVRLAFDAGSKSS